MAFCGGGSRGMPNHPTGRICTDPNRGEIAAIRGGVVMALPAVAHVARVSGEQDRHFELAGVHVVVAAARDAGRPAGLSPVLAAWIQPDAHRTAGVGLLHHIAEYVVTAVTIHNNQGGNTLLCEGGTDIRHNGGQGGWAEADGSGER